MLENGTIDKESWLEERIRSDGWNGRIKYFGT